MVHRLVLEAFVGERPHGKMCGHRNGVRDDNRLENVEWITAKENASDRSAHGQWTPPVGVRNPSARLREIDVYAIRESNEPIKSIANRYGTSASYIHRIIKREKWKHLPERGVSNESR